MQAAESHGGLTWEPFTPEKLDELRKAGKPVFIDFTAAWCINCKVNESYRSDASVVQAFQTGQVVTLKADWTQRDETIGKFLALTFGRTGVPFYVFYPANGEPRPLPEAITPAIVKQALAS